MLPDIAKAALKVLTQHLEAIDGSIAALDKEISATHAQKPVSRLLASIPGVGMIAARAIAACVPDPKVFKSGFPPRSGRRQGQNSSGGKEKRGAIGKQGNRAAARAWATSLVRAWLANAKARLTRLAGRPSRAQARARSHRGARPSSARGSTGR
jgi:transposase